MSRRGSHTSSSLRGRGASTLSAQSRPSPLGSREGSVAARGGQNGSNSSSAVGTPTAGGPGNAASASSLTRASGPRMQSAPDPSRRIVDYSSPDDKCPVCKTDRYLNPRLRLLVSPCYHKMCESCLDRIFSLGPAPCPECGTKCRKYEFGVQTFQDLKVEREVDIRRRIGKLFNKKDDDFDSLKAYNDYLEEVEKILFSLINNVDVPATEARIAAYQASNKLSIQANTRSQAAEADAQRAREEAMRTLRGERAARRRQREERDRREREADERNIVEALAGRGGAANDADLAIMRKQENERRREERMEREERQEEMDMRTREAALQSYGVSSNSDANAITSKKSSTANAVDGGWPTPFSVDMLLDFDGSFAALDDASDLIDVAIVPADLGGTDPSSKASAGYSDPWITKVPDAEELTRLRAGGYDWGQAWSRDIKSAVDGLFLMPLE